MNLQTARQKLNGWVHVPAYVLVILVSGYGGSWLDDRSEAGAEVTTREIDQIYERLDRIEQTWTRRWSRVERFMLRYEFGQMSAEDPPMVHGRPWERVVPDAGMPERGGQ